MGAARELHADGMTHIDVELTGEGAAEATAERPRRGRSRAKTTGKKAVVELAVDEQQVVIDPEFDTMEAVADDPVAAAVIGDPELESGVEPQAADHGAAAVPNPAAEPVAADLAAVESALPEAIPPLGYPEPRRGGMPTRPFRQRLWQIQTQLSEIHRERASRQRGLAIRRALMTWRGRTYLAGVAVLAALLLIVLLVVR